MRFMMLLKSDAAAEAGVVPDEKLLTEMGNYNQAMVDAGVMLGGEGLHPTSRGARIRIERGKLTVTDGPFTEAKEIVAGYFLLQTSSKADAIAWAKRLPGGDAQGEGHVELRLLYETEDFEVDPAEQPGGWRDRETAIREAPPAPGPDKGRRYISFLKGHRITEGEVKPTEKVLSEMGGLIQEMADKGVWISGEGLRASSHGARLTFKNGKVTVTDGPFAEAKELIAGFSMYRAKTKAEAIEWARRWLQIHIEGTGIEAGEIEVREVYETEDIPVTSEEQPGGWRDQEKQLRERLAGV